MSDAVNRAEMFYCCASGAQKVAELDDALALVRREVETAHRRVDAQDDEIARLKAERDRETELRRQAEAHNRDLRAALEDQITALRARVAELEREVDVQRSCVWAARGEYDREVTRRTLWQEKADAVEARVARLRAALREIEEYGCLRMNTDSGKRPHCCDCPGCLADAALRGEEGA